MPAPLFIRLATLVALTIAFLFSGCEVFKTFKGNKTDTASVKKSATIVENSGEGGTIRTEDNRSHEENEWFRVTMKYLTGNNDRDTTINNFITQPATVIYEGGKSSRDEERKLFDSSWYQNMMSMVGLAVESMSRSVDNYEKTKHSETKGIGWVTILLIGVGLMILTKGLGFLAKKYAITGK